MMCVPFTGNAHVKHNRKMTEEAETEGPVQAPDTPSPEGTLIFEQPLNERMRTFLRLDFQSKPGVDVERLKTLMTNLVRLRTDLQNAGLTFLQPLRDSEFLSAIKHRSAIPGGTCEFDLPDYYFWLTQPDEVRTRTFNEWLGLLRPLCDAVAELLWLTRQNGRTRKELAQGGTFNITFDRDNPLQLLRISLPAAAGLFPEISGSHYRCNVRFLAWKGLATRSTQTDADVPFVLSCCT
jgi:cell division protein ZapD